MSDTFQTLSPDELVEELEAPRLAPGTRLGPYEIGRLLGEGGMGSVYEAVQRRVNKRVAIKTLHPHVAASPEGAARFLREAEAAARLRHPHTVDVTDVGVDGGVAFLVMEYLEGEDLAKRLHRLGAMQVEPFIDLILPVCSALATAHQEGIIHRDLKPENIFIANTRAGSETVKLLDFGISHLAGSGPAKRLTRTNALMGTPYYMSPEQARGAKNTDARSDQYAMGVILYEGLTGRLPVDGDSVLEIIHRLATEPVVPPRKIRGDLPALLETHILRCLEREPRNRFGSVTALARALFPFASPRGRSQWESAFGASEDEEAEAPTTIAGSALSSGAFTALDSGAVAIPYSSAVLHADDLSTTSRRDVPRQVVPKTKLVLAAAIASVALLTIGGIAWSLGNANDTVHVDVRSTPPNATFTLDGAPVAMGHWVQDLPMNHQHQVVIAADGFVPLTMTIADVSPPQQITLVALENPAPVVPTAVATTVPPEVITAPQVEPEANSQRAPATEGSVAINSQPWCEIAVDGHVEGATPLVVRGLSPGAHNVTCRAVAQGTVETRVVQIHAGRTARLRFVREQPTTTPTGSQTAPNGSFIIR